uniref:Uncharacterized protein n=1 Tax=Anguilla anguilla TaxID=7936 RepID=A0A0E9T7B6_ANGAN
MVSTKAYSNSCGWVFTEVSRVAS